MAKVKFTKKGRPTKEEKGLLNKINEFLSSSEEDGLQFEGKTISNKSELQKFYDSIFKADETPTPEPTIKLEETMDEADIIEESTGTIPEPPVGGGADSVPDFFNPLADDIKKRSYSEPPVEHGMAEIPEPDLSQAPIETNMNGDGESAPFEESVDARQPKPLTPPAEKTGFDSVTNPAVNQLEGKEKEVACEQLVDTVLGAYEQAHILGQKFAQYDEQKLMKLAADGEIDTEEQIDLGNGPVTAPEFIQEFNEQASEAIQYDPEFGRKVRPVMKRVFAKRGWGMTDEQYLLYMFGKDIAVKAAAVVSLRKSANMIVNTFVEMQQQKLQAMSAETVERVVPDSVEVPNRGAEPPTDEAPETIVVEPIDPQGGGGTEAGFTEEPDEAVASSFQEPVEMPKNE